MSGGSGNRIYNPRNAARSKKDREESGCGQCQGERLRTAMLWSRFARPIIIALSPPDPRGGVGYRELWLMWFSSGPVRDCFSCFLHISRLGAFEILLAQAPFLFSI